VLAISCVNRLERRVSPTLDTVDLKAPYLKLHMRDGDVYILDRWTIDEPNRAIHGSGDRFGPNRGPIAAGQTYRVALADVALFETNTVVTSPGVAALSVITGLSLAATAACAVNPKACFGSCPTFYAADAHGRSVLQAEGFSDAIAPSLEKHDIDQLWASTGRGGPFVVRMTNEAYETHVVKQVDLLAVPRPAGGRVFATAEQLWVAREVAAPLACRAAEGDCLERVRALDGDERTSLTDPEDLATREHVELDLPELSGDLALAIGARQSLVTTFLLYQGLAYLGTTATSWLAQLERSDVSRAGGRALQALVGGIEVQVERDGAWVTVGEAYETGPLATDVHLVKLPAGTRRARLQLPRGGWRIDHVALAAIAGEATPLRLAPSKIAGSISRDFGPSRAPARAFPIVTQPGDAYDFTYDLPAGEYDVFVDSRGYYLEWMREEWMREENPLAALRMLVDPAGALRALAPAFKQLEPRAEALFWSSRYARP
jgi:hypothetical protein